MYDAWIVCALGMGTRCYNEIAFNCRIQLRRRDTSPPPPPPFYRRPKINCGLNFYFRLIWMQKKVWFDKLIEREIPLAMDPTWMTHVAFNVI